MWSRIKTTFWSIFGYFSVFRKMRNDAWFSAEYEECGVLSSSESGSSDQGASCVKASTGQPISEHGAVAPSVLETHSGESRVANPFADNGSIV
jgi:hypothetical protein